MLCTPFRPAQHVAAVSQLMDDAQWAQACREDSWQGAGEDWPNAYRRIGREEALGCVVVFYRHEWQQPAFQICSLLLFG